MTRCEMQYAWFAPQAGNRSLSVPSGEVMGSLKKKGPFAETGGRMPQTKSWKLGSQIARTCEKSTGVLDDAKPTKRIL